MAGGSKRSTIIDVARAAGVSTKTVSRVLNREPHVKRELQDRIRAAIVELNYQPNVLAQGLVRRRSHLIGLIYENPSPSYVVELQMGALDRLKDERYRLVVLPVGSVHERATEIVSLLRAAAVDGVVLAPPASDHPVVLRELEAAQLPYARIAPTRMPEKGPSTSMDDVAAAREIARYLLSLGHRDIAIIKGEPTHCSSEARLLGYSQAFADADVSPRLDWIEQGHYTFESGLEAGRRLLDRPDRPSAILAQNDDMAVGALMAARELGLGVPEDVSIVGFDDSEVARLVWPRLTTIRQPVFEMAATATSMLLDQLEGGSAGPAQVHPHELLIRESAAAPR
ncbi:LacI family DNA-binding transcriptional regulator [Sphingomonas gilva]|uniref:LacI family DNA-binding transcriptional regulator n=1 Tax=Sphingomonas gilva TaxID=2305907 RepID=A0A396RZD2_9SPHN|nr:LacI family DNA-binding transcriptional regulator [Sphingomonas gilva]RHW19101.1 LacI family DNA-binding transcriptional regulator [Sphingomonas gilva]